MPDPQNAQQPRPALRGYRREADAGRSASLAPRFNRLRQLVYALAPLFRGEKRFAVKYAGESFEVEVDDEVMIVLAKQFGKAMATAEKPASIAIVLTISVNSLLPAIRTVYRLFCVY
jgi:hypothetical protein